MTRTACGYLSASRFKTNCLSFNRSSVRGNDADTHQDTPEEPGLQKPAQAPHIPRGRADSVLPVSYTHLPSVSLRKALLQFAFWMVGINPFYSYAQEAVSPIPPCDPGLQASATISFADTSSVPLLVKPDSKDGQLIASSHIYARNDTGSSLNEWCAKGYFSNYLDRSENVLLSLNGSPQKDGTACVNSQVNAGTIKDFVLSFPTIRDDLPLIGLVTFQASGIIERPSTSTVSVSYTHLDVYKRQA